MWSARTVSAAADGAICIGGKAVSKGVLLIENFTNVVPHIITLFVELEVPILVTESSRSWIIDQWSLLTSGLRSFQ
jgi:hypothetical protein